MGVLAYVCARISRACSCSSVVVTLELVAHFPGDAPYVGGIYGMQLSNEQCESFRRDHFLVVRDVLPSTAIEAMRAELSDYVAAAALVRLRNNYLSSHLQTQHCCTP